MLVADFTVEVMPEVPGVTRQLAERAIIDTTRDFCDRTEAWQDTESDVPIVSGKTQYTFTLPPDSELVRVMAVTTSNGTVPVVTLYEMDTQHYSWRTVEGDVVRAVIPSPTGFVVFPIPTADSTLTILRALRPTVDAATIPDLVLRYRSCVVDGVVARLLRMADKPWTDFNMAAYKDAMYLRGVGEARSEVGRGFGKRVTRLTNRFV